MKRMTTLPHDYNKSALVSSTRTGGGGQTQRTIIPGKPAIRTGPIELHATNTAHVVFGDVPAPGRDGVPDFDFDFHFFFFFAGGRVVVLLWCGGWKGWGVFGGGGVAGPCLAGMGGCG